MTLSLVLKGSSRTFEDQTLSSLLETDKFGPLSRTRTTSSSPRSTYAIPSSVIRIPFYILYLCMIVYYDDNIFFDNTQRHIMSIIYYRK